MEDRKPKGHGDFANLIARTWSGPELYREVREAIEDLERHPGFAYVTALLDARERMLTDRLVNDSVGDIRATDQVIGMIGGLRQSKRAVESILYESNEARERAERAAREADAEGANTA